MNFIQHIKEYILYRKTLSLFQKIDITDAMKVKLGAFDEEVIEALYENTLDKISKEMIKENMSQDYYRGAKMALHFFKSYFKQYKQ